MEGRDISFRVLGCLEGVCVCSFASGCRDRMKGSQIRHRIANNKRFVLENSRELSRTVLDKSVDGEASGQNQTYGSPFAKFP